MTRARSSARNISHAHNVTPRRFEPNLQRVRALVNGGVRRLRVCTRCLRSRQGRQGRLARARGGHPTPDGAGSHRAVFAGHQGRQPALPVRARSRSDPATGRLVDGASRRRRARSSSNIGAILEGRRHARSTASCRATVYLADMNDFAQGERDLRDLLLARPRRAAAPRVQARRRLLRRTARKSRSHVIASFSDGPSGVDHSGCSA